MDYKTVILEAFKFFSVCEAHDPGGVLNRFWPIYYVLAILQKQGISGQALEDRMIKCFQRLLQKWAKSDPEYKLTLTDLYWLAQIATHVGIDDLVLSRVVEWTISEDYQGITKRIEALNIPNFSPEECEALILSPPDNLTFPPRHPLWLARGVRNESEWRELGADMRIIKDITNLEGIITAFGIALRRAFERKGRSDKIVYVSDYTGLEPDTEDNVKYLSDSDRLSQFCELAGIEMDKLTDGDSSRILDILHALDMGYDFSSKQGVSMQAYYGDRADSEKTQRQRLHKKLRDMSDKSN